MVAVLLCMNIGSKVLEVFGAVSEENVPIRLWNMDSECTSWLGRNVQLSRSGK